jgi:hypothetical protein
MAGGLKGAREKMINKIGQRKQERKKQCATRTLYSRAVVAVALQWKQEARARSCNSDGADMIA